MTYRDDDDAARARADALQHDLDDAQEELAETRRKLAAAEAEKQRLAAEVDEARRPPEPEAPWGSPPASWIIAGGVVVILGVVVLVVTATRGTRTHPSSSPPNPMCTLATDPPGAAIVGRCDDVLGTGGETVLGATPLEMPRLDWLDRRSACDDSLLARKPGYRDMPVNIPIDGAGCDDTVVQLLH